MCERGSVCLRFLEREKNLQRFEKSPVVDTNQPRLIIATNVIRYDSQEPLSYVHYFVLDLCSIEWSCSCVLSAKLINLPSLGSRRLVSFRNPSSFDNCF